jgi:AraC-like DNA-binding protein
MDSPVKVPKPLTSMLWFHYLVDSINAMGLDGKQIARDSGMDMHLFNNPEATVPDELTLTMLHKSVGMSGKPDFGLQAANIFKPNAFGAMGYSMMTAPTLEGALLRTLRYAGSITQASSSKLIPVEGGAQFEIILQTSNLPGVEQNYEFLTLLVLNFLRWLVGSNIKPLRADFIHAKPSYAKSHQEFFGCPVHFNTGHTAMVFSHEQLKLPLITADAVMAVIHDRYAEEQMARLGGTPFTLQTRRLITQMLPDGEPSRQQIAQILNINDRTLQRRLLSENISFKDILDDVRRKLAEMYLANRNISLKEAASLLGFAEQSSFNRAIRRWFDCSPSAMRARL